MEAFESTTGDGQITHSALPLFYDSGTMFVLTSGARGSGFSSQTHFNREELILYRDAIQKALDARPAELPDGCTCEVDVYGDRKRDPDCEWHNREDMLYRQDARP